MKSDLQKKHQEEIEELQKELEEAKAQKELNPQDSVSVESDQELRLKTVCCIMEQPGFEDNLTLLDVC